MTETIAISANFTIEPILPALRSYLDRLGLEHNVELADYDQIFQQLLDPTSLFSRNGRGVNIIFLKIDELGGESSSADQNRDADKLRANIEELARALENSERFNAPVFVFVCPESDEQNSEHELEDLLIDRTSSLSNVHVFRTKDTPSRYSIDRFHNPTGNELAHVPYTDSFYSALAIEAVRKIDVHLRKPHKVIVLDCDNTLWNGVCGEDGTNGISFSDPRLALQEFAVEQSRAGVLICLCSKNNEPDVWDVFDRRNEMPLKREHLVSWRINWDPKSANLKSLADELELGLDSFVFIDDDPAVCAEVQANAPEVFTILLPKDVDRIPRLLDHLWIFDRLRVTSEDRKRTQSYQSEVARRQIKQGSSDLASFLERLELVCDIAAIEDEHIPRVSQLSLRTNQFNSTTIRRSEADIRQIIADENKQIRTVTVRDRFGDYGLVGSMTFEGIGEALYVDAFMMSCRALGRGVEHRMLQDLGSAALDKGLEFVDIELRPTEKNTPIRKFLSEIDEASQENREGSINFRIPAATAAAYQPKREIISTPETSGEIAESASARPERYCGADHHVYIEIADSLANGISVAKENAMAMSSVDRSGLSTDFASPRTEAQQKLLQIWEGLLKKNDIGVADSFFELGGDSLLAVSLFVEAEEIFGRALPLSVLIESPTIESLAEHFEADHKDSGWKYLVPIRESGSERPLFCMHAAGGNVLFYCDLAKELNSDQPVYGVQARGVADKSETAHDRVEEMAADYLIEIRSLQPHGPYRLCGSSFGGLVAFEAARQLAELGEEIELLALFDTYAPGYLKKQTVQDSPSSGGGLLTRLKNLGDQIREIESTRERLNFIGSRINKLKMRLKRKALWKKNEFSIQYRKATGQELPVDIQRNHKAIQKALDSYIPGTYNGSMILFRASVQPDNVAYDQYLGWKNFTKRQITTIDVKGTHGALTVYPFAEDLAEKFEPFLQKHVAAVGAAAASGSEQMMSAV